MNMNIKNIASSILNFTVKRLIETTGVIISILGILLMISLISYSPNDPNFIFPDNTEIKNFLGFRGSYISDLFLQSVGLISYLISLTFIFTGISIFKNKNFFLIIENIFYTIPYCLIGSLFISYFHNNAFELFINGNGGFVGNYLNQTFLQDLISSNENIYYYVLIFLTSFAFLLSINFNLKNFYSTLKKLFLFIFYKKEKNYTNKNEIINEYIPQDEIKNLIQEDLPFIKTEKNINTDKTIFKKPSIDLLKIPSKKEKKNTENNENTDPTFLEKILLDFGVVVK